MDLFKFFKLYWCGQTAGEEFLSGSMFHYIFPQSVFWWNYLRKVFIRSYFEAKSTSGTKNELVKPLYDEI